MALQTDVDGMTDYAEQLINPRQVEADKHLQVKFYLRPEKDEAESQKAGRPIYRDVERVRIQQPGNRDEIQDRRVWDDPNHPYSDVNRFRAQYQRFKQGAAAQTSGTPLTEWPGITRSQAEELRYFGCHTVEQLAGLADGVVGGFLGGGALRQKARDYLEAAAKAAPVEQMRAELQQRDAELAAMKEALAKQGEQIAKLTEKKGKA